MPLHASSFRKIHQRNGESIRWWKAYEDGSSAAAKNGLRYVEQTLGSGVKVFLFQNQKETELTDFGLIPTGQTMISCMPDEIELARGDLILATGRQWLARHVFTASGATVAFPYKYVVSIAVVRNAAGVLASSTYTVNETGLTWVGTPPTGQITVEYRYNPLYEWLGEIDRNAPIGTDGVRLPQIGPLKQVRAEEVG